MQFFDDLIGCNRYSVVVRAFMVAHHLPVHPIQLLPKPVKYAVDPLRQ